MDKYNLSFDQAIEVTQKTAVFTTHTPVPAGNDEFHPDLIRKYFHDYARQLGITIDDFLKAGRFHHHNPHDNFSMPILATRHSSYVNGVSCLHSSVSQKMWKDLWPNVPEEHVPIRSITNGVHMSSWLSFEMHELLRRYLGDNWQEKQDKKELWERIHNIPDPELWRVHSVRRRRLIYFLRKRLKKQLVEKGVSSSLTNQSMEALNPEVLTIGFARRFATYKRGSLLFRDIPRLMKLVDDPLKPVQFIFAGKAHPQDLSGKELIKHIVHTIQSNHMYKQIVFIEDYDINVARYMVQGVDVWLNNPLRPYEASGTSGMKASVNGGLNLSVLDGWWDEAFDRKNPNGWAIGSGEEYNDRDYQDEVESKALYSIIENDIAPMFYDSIYDGLPREWIKMMKNAFISIVSYFNTHRMIKEYNENFYREAGRNYIILSEDNFNLTRLLTAWKNTIRHHFHAIHIGDIHFDPQQVYKIDDPVSIAVDVYTGTLKPEDIRVDVYYGKISPDYQLTDTSVEQLKDITPIDHSGEKRFRFSGRLLCKKTGSFGFKIRVTPFYPSIIDPYEMNLVLWK